MHLSQQKAVAYPSAQILCVCSARQQSFLGSKSEYCLPQDRLCCDFTGLFLADCKGVFLLTFLPDLKLLWFFEAGEPSPHYVHLTSVFKSLCLGLDLLPTISVNRGGCVVAATLVDVQLLLQILASQALASAMVASPTSTKMHSHQARCPESHVSLHPVTVYINSMTLIMR